MRQGQQQNRRGRNRGGRKPQNSASRHYESSGPDVKIRGTAMHIAEKYITLARDSMSSGDIVAAENYLQHAEHYNRIIMAAQTQNGGAPMEGGNGANGGRFAYPESFQDFDGSDDDGDDGDGDDFGPPPRPQFQERSQQDRTHQDRTYQDRQNGRSYDRGQNDRPQNDRQNDRQGDRQSDRYNGDRPRPERPDYDRSQNYNQHQQPQPYVSPPAFPQVQPQPQPMAAPSGNGSAMQPPESAEGERVPRRRRRRPIEADAAPVPRAPQSARGPVHAANGTNGAIGEGIGDASSEDPSS